MTKITREQFMNTFNTESGEGAIDVNNLTPETLNKLKTAGISKNDLAKIAGPDGKISGDQEAAELYKFVDRFDKDGSSRSLEVTDNRNVPTVSGQLYETLQKEFNLNATKAKMQGPQGSSGKSVDIVVKKALDIAQNKTMTVEQKKEQLQKCLENAAVPHELNALISNSKSWPAEAKAIFESALARSEKTMARIGKDLTLHDQIGVLERITGNKHLTRTEKGIALGNMLQNVSRNNLNLIASKYPNHVAFVMARFSPELRNRFPEIATDFRKQILLNTAEWTNDKDVSNLLSSLHPKIRAELIHSFSPAEKNKLMMNLQKNGVMPEFLKLLSGADLDDVVLTGLTRNNAQMIRNAFEHLKQFAPTKDLAELYSAKILHVDGWIQTQYPEKQ